MSLKAFFQIPQISVYFLKNRFSCQNVKCQNVKRCGAGGFGLPERRIENDAYRLYYTVSPQPPRGFRATFLNALSSRPSWSLKLPQFGRGKSEKKCSYISPTFSLYYSAFRGNKFPWLNDLRCLKSEFECTKLNLSVPYQSV